MPWTGLMYNFDGKVKNCIRSAGSIGNIQNQSIQDILHGEKNLQTQQLMLDHQPGQDCYTCYELENNKPGFDIISDRVFYLRELKRLPMTTYQPGQHDLHTIDVRWTNLCNFSCVYCSPEFSSRWATELGIKTAEPTDQQREDFKSYIFEHAAQLKHVYLAGGEPLLIKENIELLDLLDPEVNLRINTNLSKVDTRIFEKICGFKNVHWTVSVETQTQEFEYIRYGGRWLDFLDNLDTIANLGHKITFNMLHFLLNYLSIFDCVDFLQHRGFHANSFVIGALLTPDYLNIRHLPDHVLQSVKSELQSRINQAPGYLLEDSYKNMLRYIDQPLDRDLPRSMAKLAQLDQRRGLDSSKIFPELYKLFNQGNYHGQTI